MYLGYLMLFVLLMM